MRPLHAISGAARRVYDDGKVFPAVAKNIYRAYYGN